MTGDSDRLPPGGPPRRDLGVHVGELKLRRLRAGELRGTPEEAAVAAHAAACLACKQLLEALGAEQRAFEERVPFARFAAAAAVATAAAERPAGPKGWWRQPASTRSFMTVFSIGAAAAVFALVVGVRPLFEAARLRHETTAAAARAENGEDSGGADTGRNRIKGVAGSGPAVLVRIAGTGTPIPQRTVDTEAPELLAPGERIRIGVQGGNHPFLFVLSLDDEGIVTPLYPQVGSSLSLQPGGGMQLLPDSLELTGKGRERLVILLTDAPLSLETVRAAVAAALRGAKGDLAKLPKLALAGEQFHRLFVKP